MTVTLETLRADFERALDASPVGDEDYDVDMWANDEEPTLADMSCWLEEGWPVEERSALLTSARRYVVARDFRVFEDGRWQMLAKMKWGGA